MDTGTCIEDEELMEEEPYEEVISTSDYKEETVVSAHAWHLAVKLAAIQRRRKTLSHSSSVKTKKLKPFIPKSFKQPIRNKRRYLFPRGIISTTVPILTSNTSISTSTKSKSKKSTKKTITLKSDIKEEIGSDKRIDPVGSGKVLTQHIYESKTSQVIGYGKVPKTKSLLRLAFDVFASEDCIGMEPKEIGNKWRDLSKKSLRSLKVRSGIVGVDNIKLIKGGKDGKLYNVTDGSDFDPAVASILPLNNNTVDTIHPDHSNNNISTTISASNRSGVGGGTEVNPLSAPTSNWMAPRLAPITSSISAITSSNVSAITSSSVSKMASLPLQKIVRGPLSWHRFAFTHPISSSSTVLKESGWSENRLEQRALDIQHRRHIQKTLQGVLDTLASSRVVHGGEQHTSTRLYSWSLYL